MFSYFQRRFLNFAKHLKTLFRLKAIPKITIKQILNYLSSKY